MKTLENHVLLYDQDCPLCKAYSSAFVKAGMLQNDGRINWSNRGESIDKFIDTQKSRNEIALVNTQTGKVYYGAESLVTIIGNNFSMFNYFWKFTIVRFMVIKLYHFISYNRHIVIPRKSGSHECVPDFNLPWRLVFVLLASIFSSNTLSNYFANVSHYPFKNYGFVIELGIILTHLGIQFLIIRKQSIQTIADYLGNNAFILFLGAIVLSIINLLTDHTDIKLALFILIFIIMLCEHKRRVTLLDLPQRLTVAWLLFRMVIGLSIIMSTINNIN